MTDVLRFSQKKFFFEGNIYVLNYRYSRFRDTAESGFVIKRNYARLIIDAFKKNTVKANESYRHYPIQSAFGQKFMDFTIEFFIKEEVIQEEIEYHDL